MISVFITCRDMIKNEWKIGYEVRQGGYIWERKAGETVGMRRIRKR